MMKRLVRNFAIALVLVPVALAPTASAQTATPPDEDPFYAVPPGIAHLQNGTVIDSREVTVTALSVPLPADAWQVRFKTQDTTGAPTAYITTVMVPRSAWTGEGPRPVLSYQTPEDGVGLKCSPSYMLTAGLQALGNTSGDAFTIEQALASGWAVVAPDYEGPNSAWLGAAGQARGVLDGLRAARAFAPAGIDRAAPLALWGYSGGAVASSAAAQLQPSYAPDVQLAGVALGGNNASIRAAIDVFDGSFAGGTIVIGLIGLDRAYPQYHLSDYLNETGRAKVAQSQQDCIVDAGVRHPALRLSDILKDPSILDGPDATRLFNEASPLTYGDAKVAPVYDYHAINDELAPIGPDRELVDRYCRAGTPVQHVEDQGDHFTEVAVGSPGAMEWLADRFAGVAAPSNCRARPQASPPPPPACSARRPGPRARVTSVSLTGRRIVLRGSASTTCDPRLPLATPRVTEVSVAVARVARGRCRFLDRRGILTHPRSCSRPVALPASGTRRWRFTRNVGLPRGSYAVYAWAADSAARRDGRSRPLRRVRLR